jgi:hypothetical protein
VEGEGEIVVREAGQDIGAEGLSAISKPDSVYRGMTEAEFEATVGKTGEVVSRGDFRAAEEGTNFADDTILLMQNHL